MDLSPVVNPVPFAGEGKTHLAYELNLVNMSLTDMPVTRIEVLDGNRVIAAFEGTELSAILAESRAGALDRRTIAPAARTTAFLWVTFDSAAKVPAQLRHRLTVREHTIVGGTTRVAGAAVVIGPPLRGGEWLALDGPANTAGHRRTRLPIDGRATIPQRFATDWARARPNGALVEGDRADNKSYFSYGAEVIAVANGVIAAIKDGIPENVPGSETNAVPTTVETAAGNYVILDIGQGRFALYAHLQPGSVRVKAGDRVRKGDVLGLVGNSGNSSGPHLHFHVSDANSPLATEGLPFVIDAWEVFRAGGTWERRVNELPLRNARVRFPGE
jgi:murein DD-endopeptidase MepM/ murein hydrolase activator NlpD